MYSDQEINLRDETNKCIGRKSKPENQNIAANFVLGRNHAIKPKKFPFELDRGIYMYSAGS